MKIDSVPSSNSLQPDSEPSLDEELNSAKQIKSTVFSFDNETKEAIDHATGLFQTIINDKSTDSIIRAIPSDEYLHLLSLLDELIGGSIDKHV